MASWEVVAAGARCCPEEADSALDHYRLAVELAPAAVETGSENGAHVHEVATEWRSAVEAYMRGDRYARCEVFADVRVGEEVVRVERSEGGFWIHSLDEVRAVAADAAFDALQILLDDLLDDALVEDLDPAEIDRLLSDAERRDFFDRLPFKLDLADELVASLRPSPVARPEPKPPQA